MEDFKLQEECQSIQDVATYDIPNEHDIRSMDGGEVTALLEGNYYPNSSSVYLTMHYSKGAIESVAESHREYCEPSRVRRLPECLKVRPSFRRAHDIV